MSDEKVKTDLQIRPASPTDIPEIATLFYETIQAVNVRDYPQDEIDDWSSWHADTEKWAARIAGQYFIVAVLDGQIVGFGSMAADGYLDTLFTHKDHQGHGIASRLLSELEKQASAQGNREIHSEVSITARAFFENHGYVVVRQQRKKSRNKELVNFYMTKEMTKLLLENG